ncbi:MAG: efflux RND transporter periplasmic adaptor subunit [Muribaculaceae bacterium]|nr:efflux RND transporter periplasmic adaptor subunit [Muribaculaceae bacterium]
MKLHLIPMIAASVAVTAMYSCKSDKSHSESEAEETVSVASPEVRDIVLYNEYPGYLTANSSVDVVAKVNGQILTKDYQSGSTVKAGQRLFTIDPSVYSDRVAQAQASLTTATSECDYAREHYEAVKKALESDAVSKMEVVQAESDYEQALASIKTAKAALETAQRNLAYCTVTAPISGMITTDNMSAGNYVTGEAQPVTLATIYDNSTMTANFSIEDQRYLDLLKSREAHDSLDFQHIPIAFSEPLPHTYTGAISYMAPDIKQSTGTMNLECKIQNPYNELRPGMYVKVRLPYARMDKAVLVNDASIGTDQLGKYMYVVNDSDKVVYTPVELGDLYNDSLRIVTSGLNGSERYVTKALLKVRNGMKVKTN